jgi:aspartyl-tRNA(Asn)/glutamyl-tRNA(Gln) amidotransferase subunit B
VEELHKELPELPHTKRRRFVAMYGLRDDTAEILCAEAGLAFYFERLVAEGVEPVFASNWVAVEVLRILKEQALNIEDFKLTPEQLALLLRRVMEKVVSASTAKEIFEEMFATGKSADDIISAKGLTQISDTDALQKVVEKVVSDNPDIVHKYLAGKTNLFGALMGQIMKETKGKANPQMVSELLKKEIGNRI